MKTPPSRLQQSERKFPESNQRARINDQVSVLSKGAHAHAPHECDLIPAGQSIISLLLQFLISELFMYQKSNTNHKYAENVA